jgi:hypothetical protein
MKKETEQCLGVAVQKPPHATLPCADRVGWPSPPNSYKYRGRTREEKKTWKHREGKKNKRKNREEKTRNDREKKKGKKKEEEGETEKKNRTEQTRGEEKTIETETERGGQREFFIREKSKQRERRERRERNSGENKRGPGVFSSWKQRKN